MKILVLGGTKFLGRHIVEAALSKGHEVTIFTRGKENPNLFPDVEKLIGDRDGDLSALKNREWDSVIDTSGYVPRIVMDSVDLLANHVDNYTFISTISVYKDFSEKGIDESYEVGKLEDESVEEITGGKYGPLKVLCENAVLNKMPEKALVIRPGLIVGPYDPSNRFTYWVNRVSKGGKILAPGNPDDTVQFIDVRDLSEWIIAMIEKKKTGIYNATGSKNQITMGEFLTESQKVIQSNSQLEWVSDDFLMEQKVAPYTEVPLWVPNIPEYIGFGSININKAIKEGLEFRSLSKTIQDTLAWFKENESDRDLKAGLSSKKETELLELWRINNN